MNRLIKYGYLVTGYFFLYLPILVLMLFSFNSSKYAIGWKGFSLRWYVELFADIRILTAARNSLMLAFLAATGATLLGTLAALASSRYRYKGRELIQTTVFIVILSPDIVMGVALLVMFVTVRLEPGFLTLLLAHITFCLPFVAVTVASRMHGFDRHVVEAAQDLGAGEFETFRYVIFPLILPAVMAGWLLSFTLSLDDVIISFFVTGPGFDILPLRIYSMVKLGVKPEVNALCAILLTVTVFLVLASQLLLKEKNR